MPAYDTDPGILTDRCYAHAERIIATDGYYEEWDLHGDAFLHAYRERIRAALLDEFPTLSGREITFNMDDALADFGFPFHRV